jgi:hypothetical protein
MGGAHYTFDRRTNTKVILQALGEAISRLQRIR